MKSIVALAALSMAACTTTAQQPDAAPPAGQCSADAIQSLVGRAFDDALASDARQRSGAATLRMIRPGQMVTKDFRIERLNIVLDANDKVESLRCG